jgi:predicted acylesterase/phospholipase RssA
LFQTGRKRILALDGGGVRGMLSLGILERLEASLCDLEGRDVRLGEWFDLIGGTSTGSIIATGLALGKSVTEIKTFYETLAPRIFARSWRRIPGWHAKFDARSLAAELSKVIGSRTLDTPDLICGLAVALKRLDTGSAWLLMNNPRSFFWNDSEDGGVRGNRSMLLANIVRASTAAPGFFDPELIPLHQDDATGVFIDGGLTPHNNPSLMLLLAALLPAYGLNWSPGPGNLLVVSVGTGSFRPTIAKTEIRRLGAVALALKSLATMVSETQNQTLTLMSYFGETPTPWSINSEMGDVGSLVAPNGPLFRFLRYDARLDAGWLKDELGETVEPAELASLRRMDEPASLARLHRIGSAAAAKQISPAHLEGFECKAPA